MGVRPSELWGITWPLTAFYFDRGVRNWANFVDRTSNDAEMRIRMQMRNSRRANVDSFAHQAKMVAFNKLMGIPIDSLYGAPPVQSIPGAQAEKRSGPKEKIDLDKIPGMPRRFG